MIGDIDPLRFLEALLFASKEPLSEAYLVERLGDQADVPALLAQLETIYRASGVTLVQRGKGWAFRTAPDLAPYLTEETAMLRKPSRAAVETLAIIAYHQPCTRAEIEQIRGVALSKGTLDLLFEAGWIRPKGRKRTPGRPMLWATTEAFLDHFGLSALADLPGIEELKSAGLLDMRPGFSSYANRAEDMGQLVDTEEEEGQSMNDFDDFSLPMHKKDEAGV